MKHLFRLFRLYKQELFIIFLSFLAIAICIPIFTYLFFIRDLSSKDRIMNKNNTGVILYDRHDKPFFTFYQARPKTLVPLDKIPKNLQNAIISVEDREFYTHPGFSLRGIARSLYLDIQEGNKAFGGSTITQQLVKNALLTPEKSFLRKYQEIILSQEIERRYGKDEILEMYINSVYFGEGAFGIEDAALTYFGKSAVNLTLPESAILAGILPSPSRLSPLTGNKKEAAERQALVLKNMEEQGYISKVQKDTALATKLQFSTIRSDINSKAPHFALMVLDELEKKYGEERISRSGFKVKTTIDLTWQEYAEEVVANQVIRLAGNKVTNGAAVVIDPKTGEVKALVGSYDWYNEEFGKVNVATSLRSPGSSFKPLIYAGALEKRIISPASQLKDERITFPGNYKPNNYDNLFRGNVTVRRALANSLNIPAVEIMQRLTVPDGLEVAKRMGITSLKSPSDYGLSLVLGTGEVKLLEMTNAYAAFANKGMQNPITTILEVDDKNDEKVYSYVPTPKQVMSEEVSFLISSILSDSIARAEVFGNLLTISRTAAVKTGTAENYRDGLAIGYTPSLTVGVWVGNNDNSPMDQVAGSLGAAPIWRSLMEKFLLGTPIEKFDVPTALRKASICRYNGLLLKDAAATSSATTEYFLSGTEPQRYCDAVIEPTKSPEQTPSPTQQPSQEATPTQSAQPTEIPATVAPTTFLDGIL